MKLKGLQQVDENYIGPIMQGQPNKMAKVWRSIKDIDNDKNGFLNAEELEACFREHFAPELEGRSLIYFFRRWSTDHDKDMVNYRNVKETIMGAFDSFQTPQKDSRQSNRFMQRSETHSQLASDLKMKLGLGVGGKQINLDSFTNKPVKARLDAV